MEAEEETGSPKTWREQRADVRALRSRKKIKLKERRRSPRERAEANKLSLQFRHAYRRVRAALLDLVLRGDEERFAATFRKQRLDRSDLELIHWHLAANGDVLGERRPLHVAAGLGNLGVVRQFVEASAILD